MKANNPKNDLESRAVEALRALLDRVSVLKLREIRRDPQGPMLASVEVLGHSHTLACEVEPEGRPEKLRDALQSLHDNAAQYGAAATPVLIAPHLSQEEQKLCKESSTSFLDLEGNARLAVGEIFIGKRSLPGRAANRAANPASSSATLRFPPTRVPAAAAALAAIA